MKSPDFVHLHCHSTYSLLEALPSPEEIVARAKELGQNAVGLSDRGHVYGLIEFYKAAKEEGLKAILGMDAFLEEGGTLTLFAASQEGYEHLLQLATASAMASQSGKPVTTWAMLEKFGSGLIALTGPGDSPLPQAALREDAQGVAKLADRYRALFGTENVYFELIDIPGLPGQMEINQQLIRYGKELRIPCVVTCDTRYCRTEDREAHDVLLCIQRNANVTDASRYSLREHDYSMRPYDELQKAFAHVPEALENTRVIADRSAVEFSFGQNHIPRFPVPKGQTEESELTRLTEEGFSRLYPESKPATRERLEYELSVIRQVGFSGYFLIVADFVREAKARGITVGPGRGSAAGSLVSYCLGITAIDPLQHGLLFERFLNPERISMPDIDLDFADTRRDEVLEYVRQKYGEDHVVQICTFGTLAARAAVKDIGRAYGIPFMEMNSLAKLIPDRPGTKLKEALETAELKSATESNETYQRIMEAALKLEGKARHVSVHACGVIISPKPATHYTAVQRAPKDDKVIITQYSAKPLESLGLLKMDFLGLMNLTVIQTTLEIIRRTRGEEIDIATIPIDESAAYALLQRGDTTGVFQLESPGMRRYLKQLKPTEFPDITAMVALYRPGPMEWIDSFIKRKHGREQVHYLHEDLKPILEPTYGIGIYQEQILQIAQVFAGFSLGEADLLRRAIGKKIRKELMAQRAKFLKGAVEKGYKKELAEKIFDDVVTPFAGYGFNKSHAVGYARIAYETAYLKARFPAEFMAALLSSESQRTDRVMIEIEECRAMGLPVLPPDINESLADFTVVPVPGGQAGEQAIRFGLSAVKGVGDSSVQQIIDQRLANGRFASIEDFARRMPEKLLNKKLLECLGKSGALDSLADRRTIVDHYESIVDYRRASGSVGSAQGDLFSHANGTGLEEAKIDFPETPPATAQQKLQWEKETLGLYVSSHPLAGLRKYIGKKAQLIADLTTKEVGRKVTLAGISEGLKKIKTKKGDTMAILTLEDPTGKIEVTLFPRTYGEFGDMIDQPDTVLVVGGTLDLRGGILQMRADAMKKASLSTMIAKAKADGFFDEEEVKRGIAPRQRSLEADGDAIEAVDDEGNVIAGEVVAVAEALPAEDFFGPLGKWIAADMPIDDALMQTGFAEGAIRPGPSANPSPHPDPVSAISIHTIPLPARAPKHLLLELKRVLQTFPGREKVQLKIGEQLVPLPLTVSMSTVLEKKIEEVLERYVVSSEQ
jgi:DNA polymerase-3 subunit alpha